MAQAHIIRSVTKVSDITFKPLESKHLRGERNSNHLCYTGTEMHSVVLTVLRLATAQDRSLSGDTPSPYPYGSNDAGTGRGGCKYRDGAGLWGASGVIAVSALSWLALSLWRGGGVHPQSGPFFSTKSLLSSPGRETSRERERRRGDHVRVLPYGCRVCVRSLQTAGLAMPDV